MNLVFLQRDLLPAEKIAFFANAKDHFDFGEVLRRETSLELDKRLKKLSKSEKYLTRNEVVDIL